MIRFNRIKNSKNSSELQVVGERILYFFLIFLSFFPVTPLFWDSFPAQSCKAVFLYRFVICAFADLSISFLVPTPSNAISSSASPPIGVTERTMPLPNALWQT